MSSLFDHFSNLEITVSLSPNFISIFVQSFIMESLVCLKHFNLRKSQIMILNCVLGKLKSCFRQFESIYEIIFLFSLIAYKNAHAKGFKFKTSILVPYLDIEKVKFETVVFWFTCHLP